MTLDVSSCWVPGRSILSVVVLVGFVCLVLPGVANAQDAWAKIRSGIDLLAAADLEGAAKEFNKAEELGGTKIAKTLAYLAKAYHVYFYTLSREGSSPLAETIASDQARSFLQKAKGKGRLPRSEYVKAMNMVAAASQSNGGQGAPRLLRVAQCHLQMLSGATIPTDEIRRAAKDARLQRHSPASEPESIFAPVAPYNNTARIARIQGVVILELTVTADGCAAEKMKVKKALPYGLEKAAMRAARWWVFEPTAIDGVSVPESRHITMKFRLPKAR